MPCPGEAQLAFTVNTISDAGDNDPGDGICGTGPNATYCSLRAAVEEANAWPGVETDVAIPFANTIYVESPLEVATVVRIVGVGRDNTIISNGLLSRVFEIEPGGSLSLTDLEVAHGWSTGDGGNIHVGSGSLAVNACRISDGSTAGSGGAIYIKGGSTTIINSVLSNNWADGSGGAVFAVAEGSARPSLQILSSQLGDNQSEHSGGAVFMSDGTLTVDESTMSLNEANLRGGAISFGSPETWVGQLTITATTFRGNSAEDGGAVSYGGGPSGGLSIDSCTFESNAATAVGGGTSPNGGGLYSRMRSANAVNIVNSTFSGNTADSHGGAIYHDTDGAGQDVELSNCTVFDNSADADGDDYGAGGGIYVFGSGDLVLRNTIVAGNHDLSPNGSVDPTCYGVLESDGYNLLGVVDSGCVVDGDPSGNQSGIPAAPNDPGLGPLTTGWSTKVHPLLDGSPAIDAGNPAGCVDHDGATIWNDQRLETRHFGAACDIGSYEYQGASSLIFTDGFESGDTSAWD
jgi:CSLREA domain-containing protein